MKESNYKPLGEVESVAVIGGSPTGWEIFFMALLAAALLLVGWIQYSYVAEACSRRGEEIPQILATATSDFGF